MCMSVWRSLHCNHAFEREGKGSGTEAESMAQGCSMVDSTARASQMGSKIAKSAENRVL